jgi:hypothetical protein
MSRSVAVLTVVAALAPACMYEHYDAEYARRLDDALDDSSVDLATALAEPDRLLRNTRLVAGELDPWDRVYQADLWDGDSLVHALVSLDGEMLAVNDGGWNDVAESAANLLAGADVTLYDAIEIAEDLVDGGRSFEVVVQDPWLEVELLVDDDRIYRVWISPDDGDVVDVVLEDDFGHHHDCPHVCW